MPKHAVRHQKTHALLYIEIYLTYKSSVNMFYQTL